jgi:GT2 family glycosyltransferase
MLRVCAWLLYAALKLVEGVTRPRRNVSAAHPELRAFRPGISVIIPERGCPGVFAETLEKAVLACRELSEPWEIIVMVNGAPASLYSSLAEARKEVVWLFAKEPLWYGGAVRSALRTARFDWVYLLNSDMFLDCFALQALLPWRSPDVFALASQVFFRDPEKRREETGWTLFRPTASGPIEILDAVPDDDETVRGTYYAGGGAALFRKYLLQQVIDGCSAYLPFYWEDVEWGVRAWRQGYQSLYCPASRALHLHRTTNRLFFPEAEIDRILARNGLVFHLRNGPPTASFAEFQRALDSVDARSLDEILEFRRAAEIIFGRFQSNRLPIDHLPLERTWGLRRSASA